MYYVLHVLCNHNKHEETNVMQLVNRIEDYMTRGNKRNQHSIDMDGYKVYYEQIGTVKVNQ